MKMYTAQEMRVRADYLEGALADAKTAAMLRQAADMMEREATREKSSQVGNAAKMREALESVRNWCLNRLLNVPYQLTVEGLFSFVNTALSSPPRHCDIGTEEEQTR